MSEVQRDLSVLVHELQNLNRQAQLIVRKANNIFGFLSRGLVFRNRKVLLQLVMVLVGPLLE